MVNMGNLVVAKMKVNHATTSCAIDHLQLNGYKSVDPEIRLDRARGGSAFAVRRSKRFRWRMRRLVQFTKGDVSALAYDPSVLGVTTRNAES